MTRPIGTLLAVSCLFAALAPVPARAAGKTRIYYVAADEIDWDYAPTGRDEAMGMPFDELQKGYTESGPHHIGRVYKKAILSRIHRRFVLHARSRAAPKSNISACSARFFGARSATPSRLSSRTTARIPTACIRTEFSIRRIPKEPTTTTAPAAPTKRTAECRPERPTLISGKSPSGPAPAPAIPVPSSGSIIRTPTNCGTSPRACSGSSSSRNTAWRGRRPAQRCGSRIRQHVHRHQ